MLIRKFLCTERKRTEKRLLLRAGTWRTLVNSKCWARLPLIADSKFLRLWMTSVLLNLSITARVLTTVLNS